jgi:hypothetical protein
MKKVICQLVCSILCVVMMASVFVGCGNSTVNPSTGTTVSQSSETTTAVKPEPLKFVFFTMVDAIPPAEDNFMKKWYLENKNVDIEWQGMGADTTKITEKVNMWIASGDVPDYINYLVWPDSVDLLNKMGDAGLVAPMDEWIDKYPTFSRTYSKVYNDNFFRNKKDGKLYGIPNCGISVDAPNEFQDFGPMIREDWLKAVGMNSPKTKDELFNVLTAFKEKIPNVNGKKIIPLSCDSVGINTWFPLSFGCNDKIINNNTYSFDFASPEMDEYLMYMNKLYRAGLVDKEMFIQKSEQFIAKVQEGRVGYVPAAIKQIQQMDLANVALKSAETGKKFVGIPWMEVSPGVKPTYMTAGGNQYLIGVISSKFAKDKEKTKRLVEFLEWTCTAEGNFTLWNGPVGKFYDKNDKGYYEIMPEFKEEQKASPDDFNIKYGLGTSYIFTNNSQDQFPKSERLLMNPASVDPEIKAAYYDIWLNSLNYDKQFLTNVNLTGQGPLEKEKLTAIKETEAKNFQAKAIMAPTEEECKKIIADMHDYFDKAGLPAICKEKGQMIVDFKAKNNIQ